MWHSRPVSTTPPFMANAILNFHFDFPHPSLTTKAFIVCRLEWSLWLKCLAIIAIACIFSSSLQSMRQFFFLSKSHYWSRILSPWRALLKWKEMQYSLTLKNLFAQFMSIDVTLKVIIDASKSDKKRSVRYNFSISINSSLLFPGSREWVSIPVSNQEDPDLLPGSAAPAALPQHHSVTKSSVEAFTWSLETHFHPMWVSTNITERGEILLVWIKT